MSQFFLVNLVRGAGIVIFLALLGGASAAHAQGVFSDLFGFVISPQAPRARVYTRVPVPRQGTTEAPRRRQSSGGRYRTVCVRLCDGYFFPISQSTRRRNFHRDAEMCQSRCSGETKLFYTPTNAPTMKRAVDVSGLAYKNTSNAFVYRKRLVKGCFCRPDPWSAQERARHQMYAWEAEQKAREEKRKEQERERQAVAAIADIERDIEAEAARKASMSIAASGHGRPSVDDDANDLVTTPKYAPPSKWAYTPRRRNTIAKSRPVRRARKPRSRIGRPRVRSAGVGGRFRWPGDS